MTRIRAEDIHDAVETLRAAGIAVNLLCHPSTDLFDPTVPQCAEGTFTSRHLVQDDLLEDVDRAFVIHNVIGAVITICCVAVAAGLFLGLMTLDVLDLQILVRSSVDEAEVRYAETLLPIIKDKHRLLVTLLVMDTLAYEALPIFLDALMCESIYRLIMVAYAGVAPCIPLSCAHLRDSSICLTRTQVGLGGGFVVHSPHCGLWRNHTERVFHRPQSVVLGLQTGAPGQAFYDSLVSHCHASGTSPRLAG